MLILYKDWTFNEESLAKLEDDSEKLKKRRDNFQIQAGPRKLQEIVRSLLMNIKEGSGLKMSRAWRWLVLQVEKRIS